MAEARRNLESDEQRDRLDKLLTQMDVVTEKSLGIALPKEITLPAKDRPILEAAIGAGVGYLVTGDLRHFGSYFGQTIAGVTILRPADFLRLQ